jgi:hypothetical protein
VPDPIGCVHSNWKSDRFATGSWSFFPLNKSASGPSEVKGTPKPQTTFFHQPHQHPSHPHSSLTAAHLLQLNNHHDSSSSSASSMAGKGGASVTGNHRGPRSLSSESSSSSSSSDSEDSDSDSEDDEMVNGGGSGSGGGGSHGHHSTHEVEDVDDDVEDDSSSSDTSSSSSDSDTHEERSSYFSNERSYLIDLYEESRYHLFYASEAISDSYRGTAHGAYLSGIESAEKILQLIAKETNNNLVSASAASSSASCSSLSAAVSAGSVSVAAAASLSSLNKRK